MAMLVSIIVPCYNEEAALPYFLKEIKKTEAELRNAYGCRFELIFINDGSKDNTLSVLRDFAKTIRPFVICLFPVILEKKLPCMPA
jgi:glycosyltransferase involved in cell wall biosynthesis